MKNLKVGYEGDDFLMGKTLESLCTMAQTDGFNVDIVDNQLSISHDWRSPASVVQFMYARSSSVEEAARGFAFSRYTNMVNDVAASVRSLIEDGGLDNDGEVRDSIRENIRCINHAEALFILSYSVNRDNVLSTQDEKETIVEAAERSMFRDVMDALGNIEDLIEELSGINESDQDEIINNMVDAVISALQNDGMADDVVSDYTDSDSKQEKLREYIGDNLSTILRRASQQV